MVATVLRLRVRIWRHTLARDRWRAVLLGLGCLWLLSVVPSVLGAILVVGRQPVEIAANALVLTGSLLVVGWAVVPLLLPALDDSLEITRFATLGVPARRLAPALLVSSVVGLPTIATGLLAIAATVAWAGRGPGPAVVALLAAGPAVATCVLAARLSTGIGARVLGARRSRELGLVAAVVGLGALGGVVAGLGGLGLDGVLERVPEATRVLGWTPLGLAWAAPAAMAAGDVVGALVRLVASVAVVLVGLLAWAALLEAAMVRPVARGGRERRRLDAMLPARGRSGPWPAVAAVARRSWRSWTADPRYQSSMAGAVVAPVVIVLLAGTVVDAPAAVALSMAPLMAATIGWGRHNDVAFDGSAFWLHVTTAVPGWVDRAGRAAAVLVWALPVTVVVGLIGAVVAGRPELAAASVGAAIGLLCAGLAVSAVLSTVLPYPVPAPGANPFATEVGSVGASLVAQLVSSVATMLVGLPVLVVFGLALWWSPSAAGATLALGVIGGAGMLALGVRWGGRVYDARATAVLQRLR